MDYLYLIFLVSAFFAVVLLLEAGYTAWNSSMGPEAKRIQHRLQAMAAGSATSAESSIVKQRLLAEAPAMERLLLQIPRVQQVDRLLVQSGLNWSMAKFLGLTLSLMIVVLIAGLTLHFYWLFILLGMAAVATLPYLYVLKARNKRIHTIEGAGCAGTDVAGAARRLLVRGNGGEQGPSPASSRPPSTRSTTAFPCRTRW
jgi:tight adherence protein B